jgi:hypothetical protein
VVVKINERVSCLKFFVVVVKFEDVKGPNIEKSDGVGQKVEYVRNLEPHTHSRPATLQFECGFNQLERANYEIPFLHIKLQCRISDDIKN